MSRVRSSDYDEGEEPPAQPTIIVVPIGQTESIAPHRIRDLWADPVFRAAAETARLEQGEERDGGSVPPIPAP